MPGNPTQQDAMVHCWEGGPDEPDGCSTTCMLPDGHEDPHEWTRDDAIIIRFPPIKEDSDAE